MSDDAWRGQYFPQQSSAPMDQCQGNQSAPLGGMHDVDLTLFQQQYVQYGGDFNPNSAPFLSPQLNFAGEAAWSDIGSPPAGFPGDGVDPYHHSRSTNPNNHLALPTGLPRGPSSISTHSPQSSHDDTTPYQFAPAQQTSRERPTILRAITAPEPRQLESGGGPPIIKRSGSEDEDEEFHPSEAQKARGRKRQRIPHTAVERRYRENLNAHLDKLRQAVPALASKRAAGSGGKPGEGMIEGVKPSKCEILNGAITHIDALGKETSSLRVENKALRSRIDEMERWYSAQGSGFAN